jgi:hypothetical protein
LRPAVSTSSVDTVESGTPGAMGTGDGPDCPFGYAAATWTVPLPDALASRMPT